MDGELKNLVKVWVSALISISYCYYGSSRFPSGVPRLLSVLPVCSLFLAIPLFLSSVHFCGITAFFLAWLANFRLLLFAFDLGPLSSPSLSLSRFICFACLPIKPKQNPPGQNPSSDGISNLDPSKKSMPRWVLAVKVVIFGILLRVYDHTENLPRFVVLAIYCLHTYLEIELVLVFVGSTVSSFLGCEIEPVFNEPYLATSLQDFWSRRWNLMVPAVLRPTVHVPVQRASVRVVGPMWSVLLGVVASFLVSGLMHELIYFYMIRLPPTWEVTLFFVLNGFCTAAEILVKRRVVRWRLHRSVSGPITLGFVSVTGVWLFFPQVLRNGLHDRVINEWLWAIDLVKSKLFSSP